MCRRGGWSARRCGRGSCPVRTVAERGADSRQAPSLVPVEAHHVGNLHWGQGWTSPGPRLGWEGRRGGAACGRRWGCSRCGRRSGPGTVLARTSRPGPPDRPGQGSARRRRGAAGCRGPGAGLGRTGPAGPSGDVLSATALLDVPAAQPLGGEQGSISDVVLDTSAWGGSHPGHRPNGRAQPARSLPRTPGLKARRARARGRIGRELAHAARLIPTARP